MKRHSRFVMLIGLSGCLMLLATIQVNAQLIARVYVDALNGVNSGTCPLTAPCKTFAYAVTHVTTGGEVIALTAGGYGPVMITKSMTITSSGNAYASVFANTGVSAILINAASATVTLRGLSLTGTPGTPGDNGVVITQASAVHIENCVIRGFVGDGILMLSGGKLYVKDSLSRDNNGGIDVDPPVGNTAQVSIDNTRVENNANGNGIRFFARTTGTISRTVASGNNNGIQVNDGGTSDAANASTANISDCVVSNNSAAGISVFGTGSVARVSNSTVTNNSFGFLQVGVGNVFESRSNNTVRGNATDTSGVITPIAGT